MEKRNHCEYRSLIRASVGPSWSSRRARRAAYCPSGSAVSQSVSFVAVPPRSPHTPCLLITRTTSTGRDMSRDVCASVQCRVVEHRTRLVCLGETPSPRVRCRLALFTYLLTSVQCRHMACTFLRCIQPFFRLTQSRRACTTVARSAASARVSDTHNWARPRAGQERPI